MLTDLDICKLLQAQYDQKPDVFDATIEADGVYASVKHYDFGTLVAFRGSTTPLDFFRDFEALMIDDPELGGVEQGFMQGLRTAQAHVNTLLAPETPAIIAGHSLGAARAYLFAALRLVEGGNVGNVTVFGSPRPGAQKVKDILASTLVHSYKNAGDPVTDVPFSLPPLVPYCEPREFIMLDVPPRRDDDWGIVAPHRLEYYQKGLEA